jgi:oxygen-independent coproporphyrinogen-3 oxidase
MLLIDEISRFVSSSSESFEIKTVYIGGGTPSNVPLDLLRNFLTRIKSVLPNVPLEFTIEANPGDVSTVFVKIIFDSGVTRVSMGAQSFQDDVLSFLGRIHSSSQIISAYENLRDGGFNNLSLDLIHGVPGFGIDRWKRDLETMIKLNPEHVSLYALSVENGTAFFERQVQDSLDPDSTADEYHLAVDMLRNAGYNRYEISNFAKPGFECKHNLNYWDLGEYVGFGPSAGSYMNGVYSERINEIPEYVQLLKEGKSTIGSEDHFDKEGMFKNSLMMGMRMEKGISISSFKSRFGIDLKELVISKWKEYIDMGHVILDDDSLRFSDTGFYVSNSLLSMLM